MRSGAPAIAALARSLDLLEAIIADDGKCSTLENAVRLGIPHATAHRMVKTLVSAGFLTEISRGRYIAGRRIRDLALQVTASEEIRGISRRHLLTAATKYNCVAHLGVLQDGMVTYVAKEGTAGGGVFTREGSQLEAYCSALGKILLAQLSPNDLQAYLSSGPFVRITSATITDPLELRRELDQAAKTGIAWDKEEIAFGLICCAAPVTWPDGEARAAVSLSLDRSAFLDAGSREIERAVTALAQQLSSALGSFSRRNA